MILSVSFFCVDDLYARYFSLRANGVLVHVGVRRELVLHVEISSTSIHHAHTTYIVLRRSIT